MTPDLSTSTPPTNEQIWRAQEVDRQVFPTPQTFSATAPVPLFWFDPISGESFVVGKLFGTFTAQARFVFRPTGARMLEVRYRIDQDFGLTAISPVVKASMTAAGYTQSVETYVPENRQIQSH